MRETISVRDAAGFVDGELLDERHAAEPIGKLSSLRNAGPGALVHVSKAKGHDLDALRRATAVLCVAGDADKLPPGPARIVVAAPLVAFAMIGRHLYPDNLGPARTTAVDGCRSEFPDARVSRLALVEDGVSIEPGAVIGDGAAIGEGTVVGANAVIANSCQIGRNCRIGPGSALQYTLIGNGVVIHGGVQIGQDGFGFVPGPAGLEKVPQLGRVIIQDKVEIGANAAIDRGTLDDTVIGEGTKIDNLVQIAHNVTIGRYCVIAGHSGISGSVTIGDGCMFGGRVGIADHVTIGSNVKLAAASGVMHDIPSNERWAGLPAMPAGQTYRQYATLRKLSLTAKKPKSSE